MRSLLPCSTIASVLLGFLCFSSLQNVSHGLSLTVNSNGKTWKEMHQERRTFLGSLVTAATTASLAHTSPSWAVDEEDVEVYFGCGCFWHVQHEFVEAERKILNRKNDLQLTARAGYAGGKVGADKEGRVCYHNAGQVADYGKLGHAEVVQLKIPPSKFKEFAVEYFNLFDANGNRPDQFGDRGPEYRNLVGLPGGASSAYAKLLVQASQSSGDKLDFAKGKGNDADARAVTFVMDTAEYPFFVAEQYHQFHDGFNIGENYPDSYNNIASVLAKEKSLGTSACPNGLLGLGAFGL